jgi:phage tail-like protein
MNGFNQQVALPPLRHRFSVYFYATGPESTSVDIHFQKVSGLNAEVDTDTIREGGQNLYSHRIPKKINFNNLVLERGVVIGSTLYNEFYNALFAFKFNPSNVLITLLNENSQSIAGWLFVKAYPVKWSFADFDSDANAVAIETMELAYSRFQIVKL